MGLMEWVKNALHVTCVLIKDMVCEEKVFLSDVRHNMVRQMNLFFAVILSDIVISSVICQNEK